MTDIRWGIMSTSNHAAKTWLPGLRGTTNGTVAAVASRNADRAQQYADENDIPTAHGSYEDLLADDSVDAVYIPLPNHLHKEWTIKAAEAGKHVLCEKPTGLNAAETEAMVAAFEGTGLKFMEAFQWRHHPQGQKVRDLVDSGVIGDVKLLKAGFSFMLDRPQDVRWEPSMGGGALYDLGCYPISLLRYITRREPLSVTAQIKWGDRGVDTLAVATLEFPDDVMAHLNCSFELPLARYYTVCGVDGTLTVNRTYNPIGDEPGEVVRLGPDRKVVDTYNVGQHNSYTLMIEDFNRAIIEDTDPPYSGQDAINNMRVIDAIFEAARTGSTVAIN